MTFFLLRPSHHYLIAHSNQHPYKGIVGISFSITDYTKHQLTQLYRQQEEKLYSFEMLALALLSLLLTALVRGELAIPPITIKPTIITVPPPDVCIPLLKTAVDEITILNQLNSRELAPEPLQSSAADAFSILKRRCEDGPLRVIHTVPNEFHWPRIYRGSCDNLFCQDPPCFVHKKIWCTECVLVYQLISGYWREIGYRNRRFIDHLSCGYKQCTDIRERQWCINTRPCPNTNNLDSFCFWIPFNIHPLPPVLDANTGTTANSPAPANQLAVKPVEPTLPTIKPTIFPLPVPLGRCACCNPVYCVPPRFFNRITCRCECPRIRCPPGQIFNFTMCKCDCPPRSKRNSVGQCVGDCDAISELHCRFTFCRDNPHLQCQVENWKCKCPSCQAAVATEPDSCSRTRCLEQRSKPHCVTDPYTNKCRCPRCEDQKEKAWCKRTYCGINNNIQCKWEYAWNKCFCPH